ncbi:unnamed protein product (macronuclear) [Paramecium tetraurelia]|uniref:Uncharacterized protein n=1 Tax=Paramecium tetraurelia TaxID=5888 RepID=A0CJY6_PARTE|nr:uncharacterized protein GSPATT00000815001 [Paramecium tetraurelia]CAK71103.1 unnamed protein product [Paramecium tetraurelia]|eukprot:XP_001438500.1 hypothetical protein (macronuclear) [Paramecium tetraurelia strain d4-2]
MLKMYLTIRQVELEGNTEKLYTENIQGFQFENIKFSSTSYKLEGVHFHVIIEIYRQDDIFQTEPIKSVIFPPIFVDSRKAARNTKRFDYQKNNFFDRKSRKYQKQKILLKELITI